ncbi:MAG: redoxin protein [Ramlibacter sp.]|nr:redoxin protein [Ramlibacter sp.]
MTTDSINPAAGPPSRRRLLYAGVAGAAAIAGAGVALWKVRPGAGSDTAALLWPLKFDTPAGSVLDMQTLRGKPLVVNFWATWCPPCVEELPLLDGFYRQNSSKGWQVVGLAIDQPSAVRAFLQRTPVSFPVGMAGLGGTELGAALGNLAGGLPFTVALGAGGLVLQRKMGRLSPADLAQWSQLG